MSAKTGKGFQEAREGNKKGELVQSLEAGVQPYTYRGNENGNINVV